MRELKYFVKGAKGNIELSKGAFLALQRIKNKRVFTKKVIVQTRGQQNKKVIIKQIKSNIKIPKNKKITHLIPKINAKKTNRSFEKKQCPDTVESLKHKEDDEQPIISGFSLFGNDQQVQNQKQQNDYRPIPSEFNNATRLNEAQQNQNELLTNHFPNHSLANLHSDSMVLEGDCMNDECLDDCESSSWSMINEHIQFMQMSLALSCFDRIYGAGKKF